MPSPGNPSFILFILGAASLLFSLALTPLFRDIAVRLKIVDAPDNHRKLHTRPIPRIGGIAIVLSYLGSFLFLTLISRGSILSAPGVRILALQILPAGAVVFATGLIDDVFGLKPWQKLAGQLMAAGLACAAGVRITGIAGHAGQDWWSVPLTIAWLLGCTNAFNLIDGIDGLAAGVGLLASCTTLLAAILQGNVGLAIATVPLIGCLLGFLRYNFSPASIFLGDSGSLSIGFLLGLYAALWSQKSATLIGMLAPMMALALPLLDVFLSVTRRFLGNQPIFGADRGHIHHRLLARGLAPRATAWVLYGVCGIAAVLSLLQGMFYNKLGGLVILLFCAMVCIGVRELDYVEFAAAGNIFRKGTLRRVVQEEIGLRQFQNHLRQARSPEDYWIVVRDTCVRLGFPVVEMKLNGEKFFFDDRSTIADDSWAFQAALPGFGYLKLSRCSTGSTPLLVMQVFETLQKRLELQVDAMEFAFARREPVPVDIYTRVGGEKHSAGKITTLK